MLRLCRGSRAVLLGAIALLAASSPSVARADLVVLQESNGFPGGGESENARQKVTITEDKLKVLDEAHGWALFVRLDKKSVTEAWAAEKGFVEKPLSFYSDIRDKREKTRAEKVAEYKKLVEKAKDDSERNNLKRELEKAGLREDGKTVARYESFDEKKTVSLIIDNVKKDVVLTHHIVRENEGSPVFDIWAADEIAQPVSVLKFYREIGTFSDEVVKTLTANLKGFPIEITAVLDNGNEKKTLHSKVHEIRNEKVEGVEYDVPAGFKEVKGPAANAAPNAEKFLCTICGKECTPGDGQASFFVDPWSNKRYPVCSEEHRKEVIRKLAAEQRQKQGGK